MLRCLVIHFQANHAVEWPLSIETSRLLIIHAILQDIFVTVVVVQ